MDDQKPQAKIPVKKSDGTTVFLTMEEFQEYKKNGSGAKKLEPGKIETISVPEPMPIPVPPPTQTSPLPVVQSTRTELATTTPVKDIFIDEAAAKIAVQKPEPVEWKTTDHPSLLDADVTQEKKSLPTPNPVADNASAILATVKEQFSVPIPKDMEGRFDSLVLSRIRDVRSVLDFEQYAQESTDKGGLGLEEDQVGLLSAIIAAAQKIASRSDTKKQNVETKQTQSAPVPASTPAPGPRITPVMSPHSQKPTIPFPLPKEEYSFPTSKPIMQDVTQPASPRKTMGPVDEIQYFSLTDFRRLSPKIENAKEILKGKFQSLQEESYVLFLDARDAWHDSPLFRIYQETILSILQEKQTMASALAQKTDGLTQAEIDAIVEINHYLG